MFILGLGGCPGMVIFRPARRDSKYSLYSWVIIFVFLDVAINFSFSVSLLGKKR